MTVHIGAEQGQIAPTVLMPGDPMRAKHIAETYLTDVTQFNSVRGMWGFTGRYGDKLVSTMGSGMGMPTLSIYVNELVTGYGVQQIIRVGTCGAFQPDLQMGDLILAMTASTDSAMNKARFNGQDFAPAADFQLLLKAYQAAQAQGVPVRVGGIFSGDTFYNDDPDWWRKWASFGVLACEMESNALYTLAAKFGISALTIVMVSDSLVSHQEMDAGQREKDVAQMAQIALEIAG